MTTDRAALFSERRVAWEYFPLSTLPLALFVPSLERSARKSVPITYPVCIVDQLEHRNTVLLCH
jgi:hypothetical protein